MARVFLCANSLIYVLATIPNMSVLATATNLRQQLLELVLDMTLRRKALGRVLVTGEPHRIERVAKNVAQVEQLIGPVVLEFCRHQSLSLILLLLLIQHPSCHELLHSCRVSRGAVRSLLLRLDIFRGRMRIGRHDLGLAWGFACRVRLRKEGVGLLAGEQGRV